MRATLSTVIIALAVTFVFAGPTFAQEDEPDREIFVRERNFDIAESFQLDTTVPESPAFALLGIDTANVVTPRDASSLGLDLASFLTEGGELEPGMALTVSPYWLGVRDLSIGEYQAPSRQWERALRARTRFSLATAAAGGEDSDARRAAIGLTFQPLDDTDPRMDNALSQCVSDAATTSDNAMVLLVRDLVYRRDPDLRPPDLPQGGGVIQAQSEEIQRERRQKITAAAGELMRAAETGEGDEPEYGRAVMIRQRLNRDLDECAKQWRERQERADNLLISLGYTLHSESGRIEDLEGTGATIWAGYSWAPGRPTADGAPRMNLLGEDVNTRVNIYGRFSEEIQLALDEDTNAPAQESVVAISANMIAPQRWEFGVEGAYFNQDFNDDAVEDREFSQVSLNASYRLNDTVWLRAAYGARDNDEDEEFFRFSVVVRQKGRT